MPPCLPSLPRSPRLPQARPRWDAEALFLHEAVPGHHFQRSFNLEIEGLPAFRTHGGVTAFAEGWGLYAESFAVGNAMGFYQDPYQRFGQLNAELWRAIRLVVDTGLHAKDWTRQEVLDYMYANSATLDTRAVSEEGLGERFDIRDFHAEVLGQGDLPLDILEQRIDAWIARVAATAATARLR